VWQWLRHGKVERDDVEHALAAESAELGPEYDEARALFEQLTLGDDFVEFLTLPAYARLD
jgi:malate synthase